MWLVYNISLSHCVQKEVEETLSAKSVYLYMYNSAYILN